MNKETEIDEYAPWLMLTITLLGGFLRILLLDSKGMLLGETFSVWLANHGIPDLLQWVARIDQHPPLYYILLHYWISLGGDTAYNVRMLSTVFGTATIPFVYLIGKRLSGAVVGLVAALLVAISPFNIGFAQQAGMYTLLALNAAVAMYALVFLLTDPRSARPIGTQFLEKLRGTRSPKPAEPDKEIEFSYISQTGWRAWISRRRWVSLKPIETDLAWVAFIFFSVAALYSHNMAVLFFIATNIYVLGLMFYYRGKASAPETAFHSTSFANWLKAQVAIVLLWSPWIYNFIQQASRANQELSLPAPGWGAIVQTLQSFLNASMPGTAGQVIIWVVYALLLGLGLWHYRKNFSRFIFLLALFAIPFLGELLMSIRRPIFYNASLIWITIPLLVVVAAGIAQIRYKVPVIIAVMVLATINLSATGDYYKVMPQEDWNNPAGFVANFAQKGDLILFNSSWVQIPFDYYFVPYEQLYNIQVVKHGVPTDLFDAGIWEAKMTESDVPKLVSLLGGHKTVWLIYSRSSQTDPLGLIPQTLDSNMKLVYQSDYYQVQVSIYAAP